MANLQVANSFCYNYSLLCILHHSIRKFCQQAKNLTIIFLICFSLYRNIKEKNDKHRRNRRNVKYNASAGSTTSFTDASMYSAVETDDDFCDISDSEEENTLTFAR